MKIVLGPYHPYLEDALAEEIRQRREHDPLAPLLLVVPSETLRRRVKVLLAQERGLSLLNFHVLTFFQLSLNLFHEMDGPAAPALRDETFMEEALKRVIPARVAGSPGCWRTTAPAPRSGKACGTSRTAWWTPRPRWRPCGRGSSATGTGTRWATSSSCTGR